MSNGQQAKANFTRPMRSGGILVNFPTPHDHPPALPEPRVEELSDSSSRSPNEKPWHEFALSSSGETQWDDQSSLMPPGITGTDTEPETVPCPVVSNVKPPENPDPGPPEENSIPADVQPDAPPVEKPLIQPAAPVQTKRNWLERWLFPDADNQDKRGGERKPAPGLIAHFWTGGPPKSQPVRDISATGMYVVTEERWYLGTQIRITLTKSLEDGSQLGRSITVMATAVRWGDDGVGLEFVRESARKTRGQEPLLSEGADSEQLGQFVEQFGATVNPRARNRQTRRR